MFSYVSQPQASQRVIMKLCFIVMTKMLINPYIAEKQRGKFHVQYNEGGLVGWFTGTVGTAF